LGIYRSVFICNRLFPQWNMIVNVYIKLHTDYCALAFINSSGESFLFCFRISFKTFSMLWQIRHTSKAQYISKVCTLIRPVKFKLTEFSIWQIPGLDVCLYEESNGRVKFATFSLKRLRFTFSFLYQKNHYTYTFKIVSLFTLYSLICSLNFSFARRLSCLFVWTPSWDSLLKTCVHKELKVYFEIL
jgi:hypothetical protein